MPIGRTLPRRGIRAASVNLASARLVVGFNFLTGALSAGATLTRASAGSYIGSDGLMATASANVARFQDGGILVEPQRTNILLYSQDLSTGWAFNLPNAANTRAFGATDPSGGTSATVVSLGSGNTYNIAQTVTGQASAIYAHRVYARGGGTAAVNRIITNNTTAGSTGSTGALALSSDYKRQTVVGPASTTTTIGFNVAANYLESTGAIQADSIGTRTLFGAQLELIGAGEAAAVTSYIPTTTAAATRAADVLTLNWASKGLSDGAYTLRYTFDDGSTQDVATTITGGSAIVPLLNRYCIAKVEVM